MVRIKNESIEELKSMGMPVKKEPNIILFNSKREIITNEKNALIKIYEWPHKDETKTKRRYYIKFYHGFLFNPYGDSAHKIDSRENNFIEVNTKVFNLYIEYLTTRRESAYSQANRYLKDERRI